MLLTSSFVAAAIGVGGPAGASSRQLTAYFVHTELYGHERTQVLDGKGSGKVGVILPDTVSSARYTEFDAPYLTKAFVAAGLSRSNFIVQNAQGSDATQLTYAQSDISNGAKVLIVDPLDSGTGTSIENYAKSHGAVVIDYDRLTLGGSRKYYVSFNNVQVASSTAKPSSAMSSNA